MYKKLAKAKGFSIFMAIFCYLCAKVLILLGFGFHAISIAVPVLLLAPYLMFARVGLPFTRGPHMFDYAAIAGVAMVLVLVAILFAVVAYIANTVENDN